ncbi:MAG: DUF3021 family protein [Oscillospiraceae bacterium]
MRLLKDFIGYFTKITTGTLLICLVAVKAAGVEMWTTDILWHIPIVGLVTSLITIAVFTDKECSRRDTVLRYAIHFVLISATVLTLGALFDWYEPSFLGCLVMLLYILAVYGFACGVSYLSTRKSAEELNKALDRRRNRK